MKHLVAISLGFGLNLPGRSWPTTRQRSRVHGSSFPSERVSGWQ